MRKDEIYLDRRFLNTRKTLESALLTLLKYNNFSDITITDIVNEAEVNRGSFYNHYTDKNHLLDEIISSKNTSLIHSYRMPFLNNRPFVLSKLPSSEVRLFNNIYDNAEYYTTVLNSDISRIIETKMLESFRKINMNELNVKDNKISSELIASYISYAIVGLILQWVQDKYKYPPEEMNRQLLELMRVSPYQTFHTKVIEKQI